MSAAISVRTPAAHSLHVARNKKLGIDDPCGCATKENAKNDTPVSRCPCGALYLREVIMAFIGFTCYDCKRATNVWVALRELPRLDT